MKTQKRRRSQDEAAILDILKIIAIRPRKRWQNTDRPCPSRRPSRRTGWPRAANRGTADHGWQPPYFLVQCRSLSLPLRV